MALCILGEVRDRRVKGKQKFFSFFFLTIQTRRVDRGGVQGWTEKSLECRLTRSLKFKVGEKHTEYFHWIITRMCKLVNYVSKSVINKFFEKCMWNRTEIDELEKFPHFKRRCWSTFEILQTQKSATLWVGNWKLPTSNLAVALLRLINIFHRRWREFFPFHCQWVEYVHEPCQQHSREYDGRETFAVQNFALLINFAV